MKAVPNGQYCTAEGCTYTNLKYGTTAGGVIFAGHFVQNPVWNGKTRRNSGGFCPEVLISAI